MNRNAIVRVAKILAHRDNVDLHDAIDLIDETLQEMADFGYTDAEEIWESNTGLEPDYLLDILL